MAIDPATVATVIEIGIKLYDFIDKVAKKGEKGDQLQPVMTQLHAIRGDINRLGETLRKELDNLVDEIVGDIRLTQLAQLPDAHAAVADYLRTHPSPPSPPQRDDPNYVVARGKSSDVVAYFLGHSELAFMGGFIYAMNTRIEFMTALDVCWFQNNPEYVGQIRAGVNHLNMYINHIKFGLDKQVRLSEKENFHFEQPEPPPFTHPIKVVDSVTFTVTGFGQTFFNKTVDVGERAATRSQANAVRAQQAAAKKNEIMKSYDQIAATWNGLVANFASASIQAALLPRTEAAPIEVAGRMLEVTALRPLVSTSSSAAFEEGDMNTVDEPQPRYELPLRDILMHVLDSAEFQQRQERLIGTGTDRLINFWCRKALHREPTSNEVATLANVLELFGHKSFFHCLSYSQEYEARWGEGLPAAELGLPQ